MNKFNNLLDQNDDSDVITDLYPIRNVTQSELRPSKRSKSTKHNKQSPQLHVSELVDQTDGLNNIEFTYNASYHERDWIIDSLGGFYEGHWLDDILRIIKGGKEASVYQCQSSLVNGLQSPFIAAKVYRPRKFRNLKNDFLYREGRARLDENGNEIIDGGMIHAMNQRTEYGRRLMHTSWIEHEYKTMQILSKAGADIPTPYTRGNNAILMEYVGGEFFPAPTLNTVNLSRDQGKRLLKRLLSNVELMLSCGKVHGDLSAYNVLYWEGNIKIIDFPQAVDPNENRNAYLIFKRDIQRLCEYFITQGVEINHTKIANDLWISHGYNIQPNVHPGLLDDQNDEDFIYWKHITNS